MHHLAVCLQLPPIAPHVDEGACSVLGQARCLAMRAVDLGCMQHFRSVHDRAAAWGGAHHAHCVCILVIHKVAALGCASPVLQRPVVKVPNDLYLIDEPVLKEAREDHRDEQPLGKAVPASAPKIRCVKMHSHGLARHGQDEGELKRVQVGRVLRTDALGGRLKRFAIEQLLHQRVLVEVLGKCEPAERAHAAHQIVKILLDAVQTASLDEVPAHIHTLGEDAERLVVVWEQVAVRATAIWLDGLRLAEMLIGGHEARRFGLVDVARVSLRISNKI
mmetsp:Transcript_29644/g.65710  ORF Transcript_29644/g.65710 Transcript_29644/m.65710 type:complete len:276 (-) Transcript_29644:216-1043(-)